MKCPICQGTGTITLLTSTVQCDQCRGTGVAQNFETGELILGPNEVRVPLPWATPSREEQLAALDELKNPPWGPPQPRKQFYKEADGNVLMTFQGTKGERFICLRKSELPALIDCINVAFGTCYADLGSPTPRPIQH